MQLKLVPHYLKPENISQRDVALVSVPDTALVDITLQEACGTLRHVAVPDVLPAAADTRRRDGHHHDHLA